MDIAWMKRHYFWPALMAAASAVATYASSGAALDLATLAKTAIGGLAAFFLVRMNPTAGKDQPWLTKTGR